LRLIKLIKHHAMKTQVQVRFCNFLYWH
jgi:hypothetical protein